MFVDTSYLVGLTLPEDKWHDPARRAGSSLGKSTIYHTTYAVLGEYLNFMAGRGAYHRRRAVEMVEFIRSDSHFRVVEETSRGAFDRGLELYRQRPDKEYSLVDCISMSVMRAEGITDILTNDHHFAQEGFLPLLRDR